MEGGYGTILVPIQPGDHSCDVGERCRLPTTWVTAAMKGDLLSYATPILKHADPVGVVDDAAEGFLPGAEESYESQ
jgi:hypothetical protein